VGSNCSTNEYLQIFRGVKTADLVICEPTARKHGSLDVSQPYRPPQSATVIADIRKGRADGYVAIGSSCFDGRQTFWASRVVLCVALKRPRVCRVFQKELYNFESLYEFIQCMCSVLNCHIVAKHIEFCLGQLRLNVTFTVNAGCFKKALQYYSKCYCVASVTKTFTLKGVQTICHSTPMNREIPEPVRTPW
jgi:hypothetical protein